MKMKKNVAVVMSAVTALGVAAPAVANADVKTESISRADIVSKVREALDEKFENKKDNGLSVTQGDDKNDAPLVEEDNKFEPSSNNKELTDGYMNSRNAVYITIATESELNKDSLVPENVKVDDATNDQLKKWVRVTDADQVQKIADRGVEFRVAIVSKGYDKDTKSSTRDTENKVFSTAETGDGIANLTEELNGAEKVLKKIVDGKVDVTKAGEGESTSVDIGPDAFEGKIVKAEFTLNSGKKVVLKAGDDALNLLEPVDKDKNKVKFDNVNFGDLDNIEDSVWDSVEGFKFIENKDKDGKKAVQTVDIATGEPTIYKVSELSATEVNYNVDGIYSSDDGFTDRGADIVDAVRKLYYAAANGETAEANINGVNYKVEAGAEEPEMKVDKVGDEYKLRIKLKDITDTQDNTKDSLTVVFKGKSLSEINDIRSAINSKEEVVAGKFTRLVGRNRYQTAIEISKEKFEDEGSASSVVIVAGGALTDGLSAAPLASAKNAPVLLAGKNGLDKETLAEIKRATKDNLKNGVAYIVGGDSQVPKAVEKQLQDEFNGVMVNRLSGRDRYATSLDVAKRLNYDGQLANEQAFVVGGHGEADAMSAAPLAATDLRAEKTDKAKVSALLVMPKDGINRETRDFLNKDLKLTNAYLIGGNSSVSYAGFKDLGKTPSDTTLEAVKVKRISGKSRFDTNQKVLDEFYKEGKLKIGSKEIDINAQYIVSGKDDALVDAQTVAAFAAVGGINKDGTSTDPTHIGPVMLTGNKLTDDQYDQVDKDNTNYLFGKDGNEAFIPKVYQVGGSVASEVMKQVVKAFDL